MSYPQYHILQVYFSELTCAFPYPMSNPLDITVEQAREVVLQESQTKGWAPPELYQTQNGDAQKFSKILRSTRESLGDTIEV